MKCPYQNFDCTAVNTAEMTKKYECNICPHYDNGVRPTGGLPKITFDKNKGLLKIAMWILDKIDENKMKHKNSFNHYKEHLREFLN